jgi:hypothetical protein
MRPGNKESNGFSDKRRMEKVLEWLKTRLQGPWALSSSLLRFLIGGPLKRGYNGVEKLFVHAILLWTRMQEPDAGENLSKP